MKHWGLIVLCGLFLFALGDVRAESTARDRAVDVLKENVVKDPSNPELWLHLGFAYRKQGNLPQACEAFEKAISLDPQNQESLFMLGLLYEKSNKTSEALRVWKQYLATSTDPDKRAMAEKHIHQLSQ